MKSNKTNKVFLVLFLLALVATLMPARSVMAEDEQPYTTYVCKGWCRECDENAKFIRGRTLIVGSTIPANEIGDGSVIKCPNGRMYRKADFKVKEK